MKKLKLQKQIRVSNMPLLQGILNDQAELTGMSDSQIIEESLLLRFLPSEFTDIAADLMLGKLSLGDAISRVWMIAATKQYSDMQQLVRFAERETIYTDTHPTPDSPEIPHLLSLMNSLHRYIHDEQDKIWLKDLINLIQDGYGPVVLCNIYEIILNNWDQVKGFTKTYNLLQCMATIQPVWWTTPATRMELIDILKGIKRLDKTA